jgi:hypothetical protein
MSGAPVRRQGEQVGPLPKRSRPISHESALSERVTPSVSQMLADKRIT